MEREVNSGVETWLCAGSSVYKLKSCGLTECCHQPPVLWSSKHQVTPALPYALHR